VFVERLDWLAKNPRFTQRFAMHVGALCREMTNTAVAQAERLHESTVKDLDRISMQQQGARAGLPAPRAIGGDEIAIRKGHAYRIVVSDLDRRRPIWVGGKGRTEADRDLFFAALDRGKPFRTSLMHHASPRRGATSRVSPPRRHKDRAFIKGPRYTLLSHREHLSLDGRRSLAKLLKANKRLNTAYLLKESFGQLWDYQTEGGARAFFTRWTQSLKWQRLTSYETFAAMIERHWDGIASYCHPENKVSLGLVEGLNNKIRVLHRRASVYRDED
jgi:transposase